MPRGSPWPHSSPSAPPALSPRPLPESTLSPHPESGVQASEPHTPLIHTVGLSPIPPMAATTRSTPIAASYSSDFDAIRGRTLALSNMAISPPPLLSSPLRSDYFASRLPKDPPAALRAPFASEDHEDPSHHPKRNISPARPGPSRLTMQLAARNGTLSPVMSSPPSRDITPGSEHIVSIPYIEIDSPPHRSPLAHVPTEDQTPTEISVKVPPPPLLIPMYKPPVNETSALLLSIPRPTYNTVTPSSHPQSLLQSPPSRPIRKHIALAWAKSVSHLSTISQPAYLSDVSLLAVQSIPAVFLGLLLNILDGVSYGMILFPAGQIFEGFGPMGVSLFFVTTVIAQLIYTFGGSSFAGGNGSMMIEVVPFFNILSNEIIAIVGEENPEAVIATTLASFSLSAILTGLTFFILGKFRLGALMGFFPRHILVGCIGGVGWFLIETGFEVSIGMNEEGGFQYTKETFKLLFGNSRVLALWLPALTLAVILRVITSKVHHQLVFPLYFLAIPIIFYIVVAAGRFDLDQLRHTGWVFNMGNDNVPWWKIYTYMDLGKVHWSALLQTMPTQLALLFFNILHPPLNVPALSVSLDQDVDTNHELTAHGYSNIVAGLLGTVPNYLVYVNTVLFYRVGGGTRLAGFMLALATVAVLLIGTWPIAYLPVMVVGALIFVLGIDLVREAVWDTRHRVSRTEYITIVSIMVCMTLFDFVIGVLFGIILACFFFVVQNSRNRSIRALYTGNTAMSTVRRPSAHRTYLQEVGRQTAIMRLQYHLFFGTITNVEDAVRELLETGRWQNNPLRFLVIDLSLVPGVDLSASEAFVRLQRILLGKGVTFVLCGFKMDSPIAISFQSVGLFEGPNVEVFYDLNEAIEWTENVYLKAWFDSIKEAEPEASAIAFPGRQKWTLSLAEPSMENSPRRSQIKTAGGRIMRQNYLPPGPLLPTSPVLPSSPLSPSSLLEPPLRSRPSIEAAVAEEYTPPVDLMQEPIPTLMKTFAGYETNLSPRLFMPMLRYLERITVPEGCVLWRQGDAPDGLYIIASGVMRATYTWSNSDTISESMVAGTLAGELSGLAGMPRNADVVAEKTSELWKLSREDWSRWKEEQPGLAHRFVELVLKVAKNDYDVLIGACSRR